MSAFYNEFDPYPAQWLGDPIITRLEGQRGDGFDRHEPGWIDTNQAGSIAPASEPCRLGNALHAERWPLSPGRKNGRDWQDGERQKTHSLAGTSSQVHTGWPGPADSFWAGADWLLCRDEKWRPVEPGTFPLAHGVPDRVGKLRAYGNAIVPQIAAEVIGVVMELEQSR